MSHGADQASGEGSDALMTSGVSFERLVTPVVIWRQRSREQLKSIIYMILCAYGMLVQATVALGTVF